MSRRFMQPGEIPMNEQSQRDDRPTPMKRTGYGIKPARTHGEGRHCTMCQRALSRFNPDEQCAGCFATIPLEKRPGPKGGGVLGSRHTRSTP